MFAIHGELVDHFDNLLHTDGYIACLAEDDILSLFSFIVHMIELITLIYQVLTIPLMLRGFSISIHKNLKLLLLVSQIQYYIYLPTRLLMLFKFLGWMSLSLGDWTFIICHLCHRYTVFLHVWGTLGLMLERCAASYFLLDYEKKNRYWVFFSCYFVTHYLSLLSIFLYIIRLVKWSISLGIACTTNIASSLMLYAILRWNQRELASTSQSTFSYDLSKRYQLKENVFSTNVLLTLTTTLAITNFILIPLLIVVKLGFGEIIGMCGTLLHFDIFSLWNQVVFSIIPLLNLLIHPVFRSALREHPVIKKYFHKKAELENSFKKETNVYFDGLRNQWDNSYSVNRTKCAEHITNYKPLKKEKYPK